MGHHLSLVISRDDNLSKNPVTAATRSVTSSTRTTLSVGVRRDMIFRSMLVTATTRTGKPCISFSLNSTTESDKWWLSSAGYPRSRAVRYLSPNGVTVNRLRPRRTTPNEGEHL